MIPAPNLEIAVIVLGIWRVGQIALRAVTRCQTPAVFAIAFEMFGIRFAVRQIDSRHILVIHKIVREPVAKSARIKLSFLVAACAGRYCGVEHIVSGIDDAAYRIRPTG